MFRLLFVRSLLFFIAFYISNAVQMIFWTPAFFLLPRHRAWTIVRLWAYSHLWLHHLICGTRFDFRGTENIPDGGDLLVASKHQSSWETYTTLLFLKDPSFVLKRSLTYIPLFGWSMAKMKIVPVDRGRGAVALQSMTENARRHLAEMDRQIIIYPEGTRTMAGAEPAYKFGIVHLYRELRVPVLPVALNSGLYWGRRDFYLYPGTIIMEFLPPIQPGLDKEAFATTLQDRIETATASLIAEAAQSDQPPPLALRLTGKA